MRIWTCCSDAGCTAHRDSLEFLRRWAIEPEIGVDDDGLHFFEFDLPDGFCDSCFNGFLNELIALTSTDISTCK